MREEEADRVADAVADDDGSVGVVRAGNPDAERFRPSLVLGCSVDAERFSGGVGEADYVELKLRRTSLRGIVVERDVALDSVPLSREMDGELLGDVERSIGMNGEKRIVVADAERAALRGRRGRECEKEEKRPTKL